MSHALKLSGVVPAMVSPLTASGEANPSVTRSLVSALLSDGAAALYILGSTGQGLMLSESVRKTIAEVVVDEVSGRVPVVVHVGAATTEEGVRLARHAASCGVTAVSAISPVIGAGLPDIVMRHFRGIAGATDLPFVVYHFDGVSSMSQDVSSYGDMLLGLPNVAGVKLTSRDLHTMAELHARIGDRLDIYSGADELMCPAALAGAVAAIGTYYNVWQKACSAAREAALTGKTAEAVSFMKVFRNAIFSTVFDAWGFMRAALRVRYEIDIGAALAPLGSADYHWSDSQVTEILRTVDGAAPAGAT